MSFNLSKSQSVKTYIVMEYVRSEVLQDFWEYMGEQRRETICDQVTNASNKLQSVEMEQLEVVDQESRGFRGGMQDRFTLFGNAKTGT